MQVEGTEWKFGLIFKSKEKKRKEKKEKEKKKRCVAQQRVVWLRKRDFLSLLPNKLILSLFWISLVSELNSHPV